MLILMRRNQQEIVIPSLDVTLKVIDTNSSRVRLGIAAPPEVSIRRSELMPFPCDSDSLTDRFNDEKQPERTQLVS